MQRQTRRRRDFSRGRPSHRGRASRARRARRAPSRPQDRVHPDMRVEVRRVGRIGQGSFFARVSASRTTAAAASSTRANESPARPSSRGAHEDGVCLEDLQDIALRGRPKLRVGARLDGTTRSTRSPPRRARRPDHRVWRRRADARGRTRVTARGGRAAAAVARRKRDPTDEPQHKSHERSSPHGCSIGYIQLACRARWVLADASLWSG